MKYGKQDRKKLCKDATVSKNQAILHENEKFVTALYIWMENYSVLVQKMSVVTVKS